MGIRQSRHLDNCRRCGMSQGLTVAQRQSGVGLDCRADGRPAGAALAFEGRAAPIAFDVHLEDRRVMHQAVDIRRPGEVVGGADHRPFGLHVLDDAQQELPEPPCLICPKPGSTTCFLSL